MKVDNILSLMLDSRFKYLCLVSSFTNLEQGRVIIEKYYRKTLYPMLKCRYKKSCPSKPHYPAIKIQKTIHIQLLCNYLFR